MKTVLFVFLVLCTLAFAQENCPGIDMNGLRVNRTTALQNWVTRTNQDQDHMAYIYDRYASSPEGHKFIIDGFGSFDTKIVAEEYAMLAVDENVFQLYQLLDMQSLNWVESNYVIYTAITNYTFNFMKFPPFNLDPPPTYDGFVNTQSLRYENCTDQILVDYVSQDVLVHRAIVQGESALETSYICSIIQTACVGANEVYPSLESCVGYLDSLGETPCPAGQLSNSTSCYYFHATAALYLPDYHCSHVRPWWSPDGPSAKCVDFCVLEGCSNCHEDAHCIFSTPFGSPASSYQCVCNDGYSGDGVNSCVEKSCSADWECPSATPYVDCEDSLCSCVEGFDWNPASSNQSCGCAATETLQWTNGVPECVPIGRCRAGHREDCIAPNGPHTWNSVQCREYGSNALFDNLYQSCLCNYGYDNPGFLNPCQCGDGKRELWDTATEGNVCLSPSQCTQNWHCGSNNCQIPSGEWLGACT